MTSFTTRARAAAEAFDHKHKFATDCYQKCSRCDGVITPTQAVSAVKRESFRHGYGVALRDDKLVSDMRELLEDLTGSNEIADLHNRAIDLLAAYSAAISEMGE